MTRKQLLMTIGLLVAIATLHLLIPQRDLTLHVLFRLFYLVPIIIVALNKGKAGGVLTALASTALFLPHFLFQQATREFTAGNIVAVVMFNLTGFLVGLYRDSSERGYISSQQRQFVPKSSGSEGSVLFFVENSPLSIGAAEWFASTFTSRTLSITLFWVRHEDTEDTHATKADADRQAQTQKAEAESLLGRIRGDLVGMGFPKENISVKMAGVREKKRISDSILEELRSGGYDFVLLGKHAQTKAQEFLFGDTAVRLLRNSKVPVLSVVSSAEEPAQQET